MKQFLNQFFYRNFSDFSEISMDIVTVNISANEIHRSGVIYSVTLDIIDDITHKTCELPEFRLSDICWRVKILKKSIAKVEHIDAIAIYLISNNENNNSKWSCSARAVFKLIQIQTQRGLPKGRPTSKVFIETNI